MKLFEMPKAELIKFDIADVITTSGATECDDDCDDDEMPIMPGSENCA